jgi:predicted amidohydrolase
MMIRKLFLLLFLVGSFQTALAEVDPIREIVNPRGKFPENRNVKVAVIQWNPPSPAPLDVPTAQIEQFKQSNREQLAGLIRQAAQNGAKLVITPEFGIVGYPTLGGAPEDDNFRNRRDLRDYVETVRGGRTTEYFSRLAGELGIYLHFGIAEKDAKADTYHNTVVAVDPNGRVIASYRKSHLFEVENNFLVEGHEAVYYDAPFGRVGLIICSDVYSDFPISRYKELNVNVLALSTSWTQYNSGMTAFVSAAESNGMYLLASNQAYFPDSGVVNPDGTLQSHIRQSEEIAYGYLPKVSAEIASTKTTIANKCKTILKKTINKVRRRP